MTEPDLSEIPGGFFGADFLSNPHAEELIRGEDLRNGMVVLTAEPLLRGDIEASGFLGDHYRQTALEGGRWCRVSDLRTKPRYESVAAPGGFMTNERVLAGMVVDFFAEYSDGSKRHRKLSTDHAWYVQLSSLLPAAAAEGLTT